MKNTAIFGQIEPKITLIGQTNIFSSTPSYITGSYITAFAHNYVLGANEVNFRVIYGNCTFDTANNVTDFTTIHTDSTTLSGEVISTWGEDDSIILKAIAEKQGTTVTNIVSGSIENMDRIF